MFRGLIISFVLFTAILLLLIGPYMFFKFNSLPNYSSIDEIKKDYPGYTIGLVENSLLTKNIIVLERRESKTVYIKTNDETFEELRVTNFK